MGSVADVAIIGYGFWGAACAFEALHRGLSTVILDSGWEGAASKAAAGIVCLKWYHGPRMRQQLGVLAPPDADYGVRWLLERGVMRQTGEHFFNYRNGFAAPKFRQDVFLLDSIEAFYIGLPEPQRAAVSRLESAGKTWLVHTDSGVIEARWVIVAAGAQTDHLLTASQLSPVGVVPLRGRAVVFQSGQALSEPMTWNIAPYRDYTARQWGKGMLRVGDTVERRMDNQTIFAGLQSFIRGRVELDFRGEVKRLNGMRPVTKQMVVAVHQPGLIVATGGHRVGLGLAGAVGRRCMQLMGA